jgi:hypothetical protein
VLGNDQQTAFEILAATYVLTFSDEAKIATTNSETSNAFDVRMKGLLQLARKSEGIKKPLCVFITGHAGVCLHSSTKTTI